MKICCMVRKETNQGKDKEIESKDQRWHSSTLLRIATRVQRSSLSENLFINNNSNIVNNWKGKLDV